MILGLCLSENLKKGENLYLLSKYYLSFLYPAGIFLYYQHIKSSTRRPAVVRDGILDYLSMVFGTGVSYAILIFILSSAICLFFKKRNTDSSFPHG